MFCQVNTFSFFCVCCRKWALLAVFNWVKCVISWYTSGPPSIIWIIRWFWVKWNNSGDDDQGKACFPLELRRSLNFLLQLSLIWPLFPQSGHWIVSSQSLATVSPLWPLDPRSLTAWIPGGTQSRAGSRFSGDELSRWSGRCRWRGAGVEMPTGRKRQVRGFFVTYLCLDIF